MRRILLTAVAITSAACSQQSTDASEPKSAVLPTKFDLDCSRPIQLGLQLTPGTKEGFKVWVDLSAKKFSVPWNKIAEPIKSVDSKRIVFVDEHVQRGVDNNPMQREMKFDLPTGTLIYRNAYSALFPVNENFSAHCKVVARA